MLGTCPNKNTSEWKEILALAGNEQLAREMWDNDPELPYREDLNVFEEDDVEYVDEEEGIDSESWDETVKKILLFLKQKSIELSGKKLKNQKGKELELKRLQKTVSELEGAASINTFVEDAYDKAKATSIQLSKIMKNFNEGDQTDENKKELLDKLVYINDFAHNYSILDEISKVDISKYFSNPTPNLPENQKTPRQKLSEAIAIRDAIKKDFVQSAIPLMAEILVGYRSNKGNATILEMIKALEQRIQDIDNSDLSDAKKEKRKASDQADLLKWKELLIDKEKMIKMLTQTTKDENLLDYWLSPLISSADAPLALFAKLVKSKFEEARMEDEAEQIEAVDELKVFKNRTGRAVNNAETFNEGVFEKIGIVKKDKDGKTVKNAETGEVEFEYTMAFVQKYDVNLYGKALQNFYKTNPKPKLPENATQDDEIIYDSELSKWKKLRSNWYKLNRQPKSSSEIQRIKEEQKQNVRLGIMTNSEYEEWLGKVEYVDKRTGVKTFSGELSEIGEQYLNKAWQKLYDKNDKPISPEGEWHKYLTDIYFEGQQLLPEAKRNGYILPSIEMSTYERAMRNGLYNTAKISVKEKFVLDRAKDEEIYGTAGLSQENVHMLPVFYTQFMSADDISVDLLSSVLKFNAMARRYDASNKINSEISALKSILGARDVIKLNKEGKALLNKVAAKIGEKGGYDFTEYIKSTDKSNSELHLTAFLEMVVYGESQKSEKLIGIEVSKLVNSLMGIAAVTTISMDALKGIANNIQGNIQVLIEATGAEFFSIKNLTKANTKYWSMVGGVLADFGKPIPESLLGRMVMKYDPLQGNFKDEYGKNVTASVANKLIRTNTLFFNQNAAEHEIQVKTMLALMDATKVIDKATGEEITLLAAHEKYGANLYDITKDENGKKIYDYKIEIDVVKADGTTERKNFEERDRQDFMNTLHALNKRMHGVYNDFDKGVIQRHSLGRLLLMYRKHLVPGYKRRYKGLGFDEELGAATEGIYWTFYKTLIKDLITYKLNVASRWKTYTKFEKAQIRKVLAELAIILATVVILMLILPMIGGDDDDKDALSKSYAYNFVMYEALRMQSETKTYLPLIGIGDLYRTVRSPSAATTTVDRSIKLLVQIMPWSITEEYKRKSGIWEKGDNKAWAAFLKVMGYTGNNFNPTEAIKSFQGSFAK